MQFVDYHERLKRSIVNQVQPYKLWGGHAGDTRAFHEVLNRGIKAIVRLAIEEPPLHLPRELVYLRFPLLDGSGSVQFTKALDRSVTGSINELVKFAKAWLEEGELSPHDVGFKLNDILLSAIAPSKAAAYGKPNETFEGLRKEMRAV